MDSNTFFNKIKLYGEFKCIKDRRRFNKKKLDRYAMAAYTLHFGHCKNNLAHSCDFILHESLTRQLYNYYRVVVIGEERRRYRSLRPLKTAGRGRKKIR